MATLDAASGVTVDVRHDGGRLVIEVTEDAAGNPGPELDARFTGLADRIGAVGGHLRVGQVASGGVTIRAEIPCES